MIEGHAKNTGSGSRHICLISWFYMTLSKWRNLSRPIFFISMAFIFAILLLDLHSWIFTTFSIFFRLPTSRYLSSNLYILCKSSYPLHHHLQWLSVPVLCFSLFESALFICSVTHCLFLPLLLCKSVVFNLGTSWAFLVGQMVKNLPAM